MLFQRCWLLVLCLSGWLLWQSVCSRDAASWFCVCPAGITGSLYVVPEMVSHVSVSDRLASLAVSMLFQRRCLMFLCLSGWHHWQSPCCSRDGVSCFCVCQAGITGSLHVVPEMVSHVSVSVRLASLAVCMLFQRWCLMFLCLSGWHHWQSVCCSRDGVSCFCVCQAGITGSLYVCFSRDGVSCFCVCQAGITGSLYVVPEMMSHVSVSVRLASLAVSMLFQRWCLMFLCLSGWHHWQSLCCSRDGVSCFCVRPAGITGSLHVVPETVSHVSVSVRLASLAVSMLFQRRCLMFLCLSGWHHWQSPCCSRDGVSCFCVCQAGITGSLYVVPEMVSHVSVSDRLASLAVSMLFQRRCLMFLCLSGWHHWQSPCCSRDGVSCFCVCQAGITGSLHVVPEMVSHVSVSVRLASLAVCMLFQRWCLMFLCLSGWHHWQSVCCSRDGVSCFCVCQAGITGSLYVCFSRDGVSCFCVCQAGITGSLYVVPEMMSHVSVSVRLASLAVSMLFQRWCLMFLCLSGWHHWQSLCCSRDGVSCFCVRPAGITGSLHVVPETVSHVSVSVRLASLAVSMLFQRRCLMFLCLSGWHHWQSPCCSRDGVSCFCVCQAGITGSLYVVPEMVSHVSVSVRLASLAVCMLFQRWCLMFLCLSGWHHWQSLCLFFQRWCLMFLCLSGWHHWQSVCCSRDDVSCFCVCQAGITGSLYVVPEMVSHVSVSVRLASLAVSMLFQRWCLMFLCLSGWHHWQSVCCSRDGVSCFCVCQAGITGSLHVVPETVSHVFVSVRLASLAVSMFFQR